MDEDHGRCEELGNNIKEPTVRCKDYGELTRYIDNFVIVCKTKKDAEKAMELVRAIMRKLDLTLHPDKTRLVGMWTGEEGFDFLGMHHRKTKAKTLR